MTPTWWSKWRLSICVWRWISSSSPQSPVCAPCLPHVHVAVKENKSLIGMFSFELTLYRVIHVNWAFGKFPWDTLQYFSANTTKWKLNHKWRQFVRSRLNLTLSINPLYQCYQILFLFFYDFFKKSKFGRFSDNVIKCRLLVTLVSEQVLENYSLWAKIAHQICIIQSIIKTFSNFTFTYSVKKYFKLSSGQIWSIL